MSNPRLQKLLRWAEETSAQWDDLSPLWLDPAREVEELVPLLEAVESATYEKGLVDAVEKLRRWCRG